jgi:Tfp pilus assembly protein FimT
MPPSRSRAAISLIEVLFTLVILALVLVPVIQVFTQTRRMSHSAQRLVDVTVHVQSLIEAVAGLEPKDLPSSAQSSGGGGTTEVTLLSDSRPPDAGSAKWQQVVDFFKKPPPVRGMERLLAVKFLPTGEAMLRVKVTWTAIEGEKKTEQSIELPMLCTPKNWQ